MEKIKKIGIITDGGEQMGMGHVYRTLSIADDLNNNDITFFTKSDENTVNKIKKSGYTVKKAATDITKINQIISYQPDIVIIDRLDVPEIYVLEIKRYTSARIVLMENLNEKSNSIADIVINPLLGDGRGKKIKNKKFDNRGTRYYYGPKYLIIKDDFLKNIKADSQADTVLITFGGSDPCNLTEKVMAELAEAPYHLKIILGSNYFHLNSFYKTLGGIPYGDIQVYYDIDNVAEIMRSCSLIITAPGLSVYEALSVNRPVIIFHQNDWQKNIFKSHMETHGEEDIYILSSLIKNGNYIDYNSNYIKGLEIGKGKEELYKDILEGV